MQRFQRTTLLRGGKWRRASLAMVIIGSLSAGSAGIAWSASAPTTAQAVATAEKAPSAILQTVPLTSTPPRGKTIVYIDPPFANTELIGKSIAVAAKSVGWNYVTIAWDGSSATSADSALQAALLKHATVVVMEPVFFAQSEIPASIIAAYKAADVPIILNSSAPFTRTSTVIGDVGGTAAFAAMGKVLAEWFVVDSKGDGHALIVNIPSFPIDAPFISEFQSEVKSTCAACSIKVTDVSASDFGAGKYVPDAVTALLTDKSLNYVISLSADFVIGIQSALKTAGLSKVKVAGIIQDANSIAALKAGTEAAWATYGTDYSGYADLDMGLRWVEKMSPSTWSVDTNYPIQLLTPKNVGNITSWNEPSNGLQQFEKLWKVKVTK